MHHARNGFLTAKGLEEAVQRELELQGVADMGVSRYLDSRVSVSASELKDLHWDDALINEQYRRFLNGS